jgi:hypothetical protein
MTETGKLSVEKALKKIRAADAPKAWSARRDEEIDALHEEIKRMKAPPRAAPAHVARLGAPAAKFAVVVAATRRFFRN